MTHESLGPRTVINMFINERLFIYRKIQSQSKTVLVLLMVCHLGIMMVSCYMPLHHVWKLQNEYLHAYSVNQPTKYRYSFNYRAFLAWLRFVQAGVDIQWFNNTFDMHANVNTKK